MTTFQTHYSRGKYPPPRERGIRDHSDARAAACVYIPSHFMFIIS